MHGRAVDLYDWHFCTIRWDTAHSLAAGLCSGLSKQDITAGGVWC